MTQQEQDAILGGTRREYREASNKLGALRKYNSEIAAMARKLADALERHPDRTLVGRPPEGSLATLLAGAEYVYTPEDAERLSQESLRAHLAEYVNTEERKAKLRRELIDQGDGDPELLLHVCIQTPASTKAN